MIEVRLSESECAVAGCIAGLRYASNRQHGVKDQRRDGAQSDIALDTTGMKAELAWAKLTNVYPDLSIHPRSGTPDFVWDGCTIDIKATDRPRGRLLATTDKKRGVAEIYVLATVQENVVTFVGWAWEEELLSPLTITNLGRGPTHALEQDRLHPMPAKLKARSNH